MECWQNVRKTSQKCPKNCPEGLKTYNFRTFFGQFLPIWSMLLFGDPVQCSPSLLLSPAKFRILQMQGFSGGKPPTAGALGTMPGGQPHAVWPGRRSWTACCCNTGGSARCLSKVPSIIELLRRSNPHCFAATVVFSICTPPYWCPWGRGWGRVRGPFSCQKKREKGEGVGREGVG